MLHLPGLELKFGTFSYKERKNNIVVDKNNNESTSFSCVLYKQAEEGRTKDLWHPAGPHWSGFIHMYQTFLANFMKMCKKKMGIYAYIGRKTVRPPPTHIFHFPLPLFFETMT